MGAMTSGPLELGAAFPAATHEQWMAAVRGVVLKGKPDATDDDFAAAFARQLVHVTEDGIEIAPLYVPSAQGSGNVVGVPGFAPFVRSAHAAPVPWEIRQRVWPGVEGSSGVQELESGATGLLIELPADADGAQLEQTLDGVYLDLAPVSLAAPRGADGVAGARLLAELWDRRDIAADARTGTLGVDPIGAWARTGGTGDLTASLDHAARLVSELAVSAPRARVMVADGTLWHDAGATIGQELAWTLAAAAQTVRALIAVGVDAPRAFATIEFRWAATADQFETIAKLRAARRLWARIGEVSGLDPVDRAMYQHAEGSKTMMSRYDPWVNTLRSTVACFAAAMGGADAVTIWPHDILAFPGGSALGRRVARNTQSVLQSESNLSRVIDPGGGSWYVEHLTDDLARTAWPLLQRIEAAGGVDAALTSGIIHADLGAARRARGRLLATRKRPLTGTTEFPNIDEPIPPSHDPWPVADAASAGATAFEPLGVHRLAEDVEAQRARADRQATASGQRPTVYLATLGSQAAFTARVTFAINLFAVGGIATVTGPPDGFAASGCQIACVCSSDAIYRSDGAAAVAALREAGATRIYLAGRGLDLAGVDEEIGIGSDVLAVVTSTLDELGLDEAGDEVGVET
jgi:methylmalonyl-CoA mutase